MTTVIVDRLRPALLFAAAILLANLSAAQPILWTTKAPMPTPRLYFGTAVVGGKIYAIGGYSGSTLAKVEMYDPVLDRWTAKAPMPTPRAMLTVAAVNGKIYAIGGFDLLTGEPSYVTEEYDPATNTWTAKAGMPSGSSESFYNSAYGGTAVGGRIYVTVFNVGLPGGTATYEYDPGTNQWATDREPVPFSHTQYAAAALNGKAYVLAAGYTPFGGPFSTGAPFAEYDPAEDYWTLRPSTLTARRAQALTAAEGSLYAVGGLVVSRREPEETFYTAVGTIERYDPAGHRWLPATSMPTPRHSPAVAAVGGKLYVIGGGLTASNDPQETTLPLAVVEEGDLHPALASCVPDATTLCIDDLPGDRRFEVKVAFQTSQGGGVAGNAHAVPLASLGAGRGGLFWFFAADNPELLIKVLNGCALNGKYWVFFSAGTNVGMALTVTDKVTGQTFTRTNPDLTPVPTLQNTAALPCQ